MMIALEQGFDKANELVLALQEVVLSGGSEKLRADKIERKVFDLLLKLVSVVELVWH